MADHAAAAGDVWPMFQQEYMDVFAAACSSNSKLGASRHVAEQLTQVTSVQASIGAFAALRADGSVVVWGQRGPGGDCTHVQDQLKDVREIQAAARAFAAIRADGSVEELKNVKEVWATLAAFAALRLDGSVVTWGSAEAGGDSSKVQHQLTGVLTVRASLKGFAALRADGSVVTWGHGLWRASQTILDQLWGVRAIYASMDAFAAVRDDGSVVTWGVDNGSAVEAELRDILERCARGCSVGVQLSDIMGLLMGKLGWAWELWDMGGDEASQIRRAALSRIDMYLATFTYSGSVAGALFGAAESAQ
ncbi:rsmH [Symbiodinium pilosum]|uniref:RsmH protein n=1 Tax=Symbiodinium pilosum TaxID=2952 RepID=A0A812JTG1_SYMPI|nr:rsmH [Symbiodinium pilosum]